MDARSLAANALQLWRGSYSHDRREHRHRCRVCNRIINAGETVWMARTAWKVTKAIHDDGCAEQRAGSVSSVELLGMHAATYRDPSISESRALAISQAAIALARTATH